MLSRALNATDEQKTKILAARSHFKEIWSLLQKNLKLVGELRKCMDAKNDTLLTEMQVLQELLSPKQTAEVRVDHFITHVELAFHNLTVLVITYFLLGCLSPAFLIHLVVYFMGHCKPSLHADA